ncbi:MAG: Cna B-type domain-containing protein, partial [Erysipelotrichaceae bacterium]|nr:Cna B-type domain-containing protein [Erysipelotrichaceae bacterium]
THTHSWQEGCFELSCTAEEHSHNNDCYGRKLTCTKTAHTHSDACYHVEFEMEIDVVWVDGCNDENTRPSGTEFLNQLKFNKTYNGVTTPLTTADFADIKFEEVNYARSKVIAKVKVNKEEYANGAVVSVTSGDSKGILGSYDYLTSVDTTTGKSIITNIQTISFDTDVEVLDGADTTNGKHTDIIQSTNDFILKRKEGAGNSGGTFDTVTAEGVWHDYDENTGIGTVTYAHLPKYKEDGTEYTYALNLNATTGTIGDFTGDIYAKNGKDYKVEYDNSAVANWATETTKSGNGGTIKLTLKDTTTYTGTKYWLDQDSTKRPTATFTLWRYTDTKDNTKSYLTASPVRDTSNQIITFSIDGTTQGTSSSLNLSNTLEKYDPKGYEYIYFLKETMTSNGADYEQVFDVKLNGSTLDDTSASLPNGIKRDKDDTSIYNGGSMANRVAGTVEPEVNKNWKAASCMDKLNNVSVEMELFKRIEGNTTDPWVSTGVKQTEGDYSSVIPEKTYSQNMPQYNDLGQKLEYQWQEVGVYENTTVNRLVNGQMVLDVNYENMNDNAPRNFTTTDDQGNNVNVTIDRQNNEYFVSDYNASTNTYENRLKGEIDYIAQKKWTDENGNDISHQMKGTIYVTFSVNSSDTTISPIVFNLDGVVDSGWTLAFGDATTNVANGVNADTAYMEVAPWIVQVKNMPKYTTDGVLLEYTLYETVVPSGFGAHVSQNPKDRYGIVSNSKGEGFFIPLRKYWVDDNDSSCRYTSIAHLIYKDGTNEIDFTNDLGLSEVELSFANGWYQEYGIPKSFYSVDEANRKNIDNYYLKEVALKNGSTTYPFEVTNDYGASNIDGYVTSDNHMYMVTHGSKNGALYVQNQRVGTVDVIVTKQWIDSGADITQRPQAEVQLKVGTDVKDQMAIPTSAASGVVTLLDDGSANYTFKNLPKYDSTGKVINYTVEEVLKMGSWGDYAQSDTTKYVADYTKPVIQTGSDESEQEHDLLTVDYVNKREKNEQVIFYKEWADNYSFLQGWRPDIFVDLYSTTDVKEDGTSSITPVPKREGYKTNVWTNDDRAGRSNSQRYWKVTFSNLPRYDENGALITYYASEQTNITTDIFDYRQVRFRDNALAIQALSDSNNWVLTGGDVN